MTVPTADESIVRSIEEALREPIYFRDILNAHRDASYRSILYAWSEVRERHTLSRDDYGRYWKDQT